VILNKHGNEKKDVTLDTGCDWSERKAKE